MSALSPYLPCDPTKDEIDTQAGGLLLDFGVDWCPHCQRAEVLLQKALAGKHWLRHLRVEDGPGRRLGRTYRVKLWPTLIFLINGQEVERLVRPTDLAEIEAALRKIGA